MPAVEMFLRGLVILFNVNKLTTGLKNGEFQVQLFETGKSSWSRSSWSSWTPCKHGHVNRVCLEEVSNISNQCFSTQEEAKICITTKSVDTDIPEEAKGNSEQGQRCPKSQGYYFGKGHQLTRETFGGSCYSITAKVGRWVKTRSICQRNGGDLVSIETPEEQSHLEERMRILRQTTQGHFLNGFWTSGTDKQTEGLWIWEGTGDKINYFNWEKGQPQGAMDKEDYIVLGYLGFAKWHDSEDRGFKNIGICEHDVLQ